MKTQLITLSLLLLGLTAGAQQPYLSREAYRDKVEAYSQILKQQKLKTMASTEARKIAHTGFLPKIDINADGTLNMSDLNAWNEPVGEYRNHTYQGVFIVSQPLYTGGALNAQHKIAKADERLNQENVLQRRADYESTEVNIMKSQAQRKAALSQFNPQLNMYFSGGWATATPNLGYDVSFNPIVGINLNIPIFRWGARFKTNRQQKAYIGIQKLQQSYVTDNINEELSAALTKLTETEYQVKTAKETMSLANENLDLVSFSYNEGKANMVDVLSAQLSWTQAHTNLINAYLSEKMAVAEYRKVISE